MNITCTILHSDKLVIERLENFVRQTPFLTLHGCYYHPVEALSKYYEQRTQLFFVGIENDEMDGLQFCKLLEASTRVIFIATDKGYAADCFRMDALDYILESTSYPIFLEAANKALRWFNIRQPVPSLPEPEEKRQFIYIKSEYRVMRLELSQIKYVEGLGDYIKIYCHNEPKPILSLCSMKSLEQILPDDEFIRVHRSYIVRKESIQVLERGNIVFGNANIPVGDSYRKRFQEYLSHLPIL